MLRAALHFAEASKVDIDIADVADSITIGADFGLEIRRCVVYNLSGD
jgi:hypothetical protein